MPQILFAILISIAGSFCQKVLLNCSFDGKDCVNKFPSRKNYCRKNIVKYENLLLVGWWIMPQEA